MTITIKSAVWANEAKTAIRAEIVLADGAQREFTVIENDPDADARQVWTDCIAGKFPDGAASGGVIGDYVPRPDLVIDMAALAATRIPLAFVPPNPPEIVDTSTPVVPLPLTLPQYAASKRYAVETGGITVAGMTIDTDRASQAMINGAYVYSQANPDAGIKFKASSGFVSLTGAQVAAIAHAVGTHVQACFAAEADVDAAIAAGTVTTREQIDAWAWPARDKS